MVNRIADESPIMRATFYLYVNTELLSLKAKTFPSDATHSKCTFCTLRQRFCQIFGKIVSIRLKTHSNINLVASRHIEREKASFLVDVRRLKRL